MIDHLYGIHFTIGNAIVTANVRELPPTHPVRRLLTPFGFRTEAINYQAALVLSPEYHLIHRAGPLTNAGMAATYAYANTSARLLTWSTAAYKIRTRRDSVDTFNLPMDEDGTDYYNIINRFVRSYLQLHYDYPTNTCGSDATLVRWYQRAKSVLVRARTRYVRNQTPSTPPPSYGERHASGRTPRHDHYAIVMRPCAIATPHRPIRVIPFV